MDPDRPQIRNFGRFRLDVNRKVLWFEEEPVDLPLKEIELLCVLTEKSDELLTKEEILSRVWANSYVEESNLSRHIYLIRQTFRKLGQGEDWIRTVPRRGYRFTGQVTNVESEGPAVVIETHSVTRTLMEEVQADDEDNRVGSPILLRTPSRRITTGVVVGALVPLMVAIGIYAYHGRDKGNSDDTFNIKSIAVLPFKTLNSSGQKSDEGIGIADTVITRLSAIQAISVRPTSAVIGFANSDQDSAKIGKTLLVDAVLEGSIYRSGDKTRINARLINVKDEKLLWSSQFERLRAEEFRLHNEIALELANALSLNLSDGEKRALTKRSTESVDAYELYLMGRTNWNKRNYESLTKAEHLFRKAIDADPTFALAYVGLADSQMFGPAASNEGRAALNKAIALDPELGEAYASLGFLLTVHEWEWQKAEDSFKKALELNPGYPTAHHWYATLLSIQGRHEEAKAQMFRAIEINPLSYNCLADLGQIYYFNREYDKAKEYCEKALALYPEFSYAHIYLIYIHLQTGNYEAAIDEVIAGNQFLFSDSNQPYQQANVEKAKETYRRSGIQAYLRNLLIKPTKLNENGHYGNAKLYSLLEDEDKAIASLELSLHDKEFLIAWVKADPTFDRLRSNPRFKAVLQKLNLPPDA